MFNERIAVVDCAFGRTTLGVFAQTGGRLQLLDHLTVVHAETGTGEAVWQGETKAALKKICGSCAGLPVVLVLPAAMTLTKYVRLPPVDDAKREKVLRFEAAQAIPLPLDEVVWGSAPIGAGAAVPVAVICAAKRQLVEALCAAAEEAGLQVRQLLPATLALGAAAEAADPGTETAQAVIGAGEFSTVVVLRSDGISRVRAGSSGPLRNTHAPETAAQISAELARTIAHFQKTDSVPPPREVHLTGVFAGTAVVGELSARLNLPVHPFDALRGVEVARGAEGAAQDALRLADLVGAAVLVSGDKPALSLLPPRLRATEDQRRRRPWWAIAAALLALTLLPPWLHYRTLRIATEAKIAALESELAPLREREARIRHLLADLAAARASERQLRGLLERRDAWVGLLADLQERLGRVEDAWFDSMKVSASGAPGKGEWRITIAGRLLDKTNPDAPVSREASARVRTLLSDIDSSPFVSVAGEKFSDSQAGILHFNLILVPKADRPL